MPKTKITAVPNARVPIVKRLYERAGATLVEVTDNGDNTSDILVTFPEEQDHASLKAKASVPKTKP